MSINKIDFSRIVGTSFDIKPMNLLKGDIGTVFYEKDTRDLYDWTGIEWLLYSKSWDNYGTTFIGLDDTPSNIIANQMLIGNALGDGLIFAPVPEAGIGEAPLGTGKQYGREEGAWTEIVAIADIPTLKQVTDEGSTTDNPIIITSTPINTTLSASSIIALTNTGSFPFQITFPVVTEATSITFRPDVSGVVAFLDDITAAGIPEAPIDGTAYSRQDAGWVITPPGAKGDTGDAGADGLDGATGAQGIQGITGDPGPQGDAGQTGPQGAQGSQGIQGNQGIQGDSGADSTLLLHQTLTLYSFSYNQGYTLSHVLGTHPKLWVVYLVCKIANTTDGTAYQVGDLLTVSAQISSENADIEGVQLRITNSKVYLTTGQYLRAINYNPTSGDVGAVVDPTKWSLQVQLYA
jgi:hypothetical protein